MILGTGKRDEKGHESLTAPTHSERPFLIILRVQSVCLPLALCRWFYREFQFRLGELTFQKLPDTHDPLGLFWVELAIFFPK
jgi:hypothetical protein